MHIVAILALDGVVPFDLATPLAVFGRTLLADGQAAYEVRICAPRPEVDAGLFKLHAPWPLTILAEADTIILPGLEDITRPLSEEVREALRCAAARGARIASICVGAFIFANTGLLDGLPATTHWLVAQELARRYPRVKVDANVLYIDNGQFLTSAGAAAGLDLCLHMVRRDYGSAVAAEAARISVVLLERDGGQAQFITHNPPPPDGTTLEPLLHWMEQHSQRELTLEAIAEQAMISTRTLSRRFREQLGLTPLQWLNRARLRKAQCLLETSSHPIEWIAEHVGFGSTTTFRDQFKQLVGVSPQSYRRAFRSTVPREIAP